MNGAIAAVILAAGGSSRFGSPKQLLTIDGQTLVRRAARAALDTGCSPVIVVLGAAVSSIAADPADLPVVMTVNPNWQKGMGTSLIAGLDAALALHPDAGGLLVLLCDQPRLSKEAILRLLENWRAGGKPMAASRYGDVLGPPACFGRAVFPAIRKLSPAEGARQLLRAAPDDVCPVDWPDGAIDIDTVEDWKKETLMTATQQPAAAGGVFKIGGDLPVHRLGFGAMQITGPGVWGEPADRPEAVAVLRRTLELGINLIDTANSYGPYVSEELIREALFPYPKGLVIATKAGLLRTGPAQWVPLGRPAYLRQECEMSLRRLRVSQIDLYQLHRIDPEVPADEQFGLLRDLQKEGKVRHVGLSEVNVAEIKAARRVVAIVTVQNRYNLIDRKSQDVLDYCTRENIGFIPWFPLATGDLARPGSPLARIAERLGAQPAQVAIAWLLKKSPVMLPIPGTSKVKHLEQNTAAALLKLDDATFGELDGLQ